MEEEYGFIKLYIKNYMLDMLTLSCYEKSIFIRNIGVAKKTKNLFYTLFTPTQSQTDLFTKVGILLVAASH